MKKYEQYDQIDIARYLRTKYPDLLWSASVGGLQPSMNARIKMHKMGYNKGIPDLMIFEPRNGFHGLFIELKRDTKFGPSSLTPDQIKWIDTLNTKGYKAICCHGKSEAIHEIYEYLFS